MNMRGRTSFYIDLQASPYPILGNCNIRTERLIPTIQVALREIFLSAPSELHLGPLTALIHVGQGLDPSLEDCCHAVNAGQAGSQSAVLMEMEHLQIIPRPSPNQGSHLGVLSVALKVSVVKTPVLGVRLGAIGRNPDHRFAPAKNRKHMVPMVVIKRPGSQGIVVERKTCPKASCLTVFLLRLLFQEEN